MVLYIRYGLLQGLVHVWEYLKGCPQTGSIFAIDAGDFKPHTQLVEQVLKQHQMRLKSQESAVKLPAIELLHPNAVFHREVWLQYSSANNAPQVMQACEWMSTNI